MAIHSLEINPDASIWAEDDSEDQRDGTVGPASASFISVSVPLQEVTEMQ